MASLRTKYRELSEKVKSGKLVRIGKGIYVKPQELFGIEGDFYKATLLSGGEKSAICLMSALQYFGLLEQIIGQTWILVSHNERPRRKSIKVIRARNPQWDTGIRSRKRFNITNVERSIVDAFRYQKLVGIPTALYALRTAIKEKLTTKNKIFEMAKKLKVEKTLIPYLESL